MISEFCDDYTMTVMTVNIRYLMDVKMNAIFYFFSSEGFFPLARYCNRSSRVEAS